MNRAADFLAEFCKLRPFAFHLTSNLNLEIIRVTGHLYSARHILESCGKTEWLTSKRLTSQLFQFNSSQVLIRDQAPLHEANIAFTHGMKLGDFIAALISKVFFWPGNAVGPIEYGRNYHNRYLEEGPVILRIPTQELIQANLHTFPLFCRCNSGSPRRYNGLARPRGPETFLSAEEYADRPSTVKELVLEERVALPISTEFSTGAFVDFKPFF